MWLAKHLPQNRDIFMTGGGNGGFNLYKYHYPAARSKEAKDNHPMGVPGTVRRSGSPFATLVAPHPVALWPLPPSAQLELLNSRVISTQPIISCDWSMDYEGLCCLACLDQTMRIFIVTKLSRF